MKQKINILYYTDGTFRGGVVEYVSLLCERLMPDQFYLTIICANEDMKQVFTERLRNNAVSVRVGTVKNKFDISGIFRFWLFLRNGKFDVFHFNLHTIYSPRLVSLTPILACFGFVKAKTVTTIHTTHYTESGKPCGLLLKLIPKIAALSDAVIAPSEPIEEELETKFHLSRKNLQTINNGVDEVRFDSSKPRSLTYRRSGLTVIGTTGTLNIEKNHPVMLRAFKKILEQYPDCLFLIIGTGTGDTAYKKLAVELGISEKVIFASYQTHVEQWLAELDVFMFASSYETFGFSVAEAMMMNVPVVSTNVGGLKVLVKDNETALVVPVGNDAALAEAVVKLIDDTETANRLRQAAHRLVAERYTADLMVRETSKLYDRLLK